MIFTDLFESRDICRVCGQTPCNCTHVTESNDPQSRKLGKIIGLIYNEIYDMGDDALDYLNDRAPVWAELWDRYEGDIDSIIAEEDPVTLGKAVLELKDILNDLRSDQGVAEGSDQLPTQGADYSKHSTAELKMMLRPGILHRNEARFKSLIRKELQKREQQGQQGVAEGLGNIGPAIKSLYRKIHRAGDDEIEYFYNDSPIFAQYWDEYEGDLDSIIAEVDPAELAVIKAELESYVEDAGLMEVSDATLTSYLTKVDADSQKHKKDPTKRSPEKRNRSVAGFARAFNKLDARKEKGVEEGLADDFLKMAQAKGYKNARIAGTPEQERERTQQMLAQRAKDRQTQSSPEISDEQRAQLQAKLKELEAQFDPNYQYSDDYSFWSRQQAISQQINSIRKQLGLTEVSKKTLGDYLHSAHKDVVDRASSSSFQSGQAGNKYNKADISAKEKQREKGIDRAITRLTREGSSVAEAWASRYPNINADIAECKSGGDADRLKKLMAIKSIIDADLGEQAGLGFGE